ncbi:MAG: L-threonylcarbamoyladenylate synthase [Pseudomonadota bacterium]
MGQFFQINCDNPQSRLVNQAVAIVRGGGVMIYPTDSGYAFGCCLGNKAALDKIRRIKKMDAKQNFTLLCRDLSELSLYAKVDNTAYRLLKTYTPGAYTFILPATHEVPRRLQHPKRKTIGLRVPNNAISQALLDALGEPLMTTSLPPLNDELMMDPEDIRDRYGKLVDLIIDGGFCGSEATSIIDLTDGLPQIVRRGAGDVSDFE